MIFWVTANRYMYYLYDLINKINACFSQNDICFVDDRFPPTPVSVGDRDRTISQWLRICDIVGEKEDEEKTWTMTLNPQPSDIRQGYLGNCWLMAALTLITQQPRMLSHILLTSTVNKEGIYLVRICHNGLWKTVLLDDCFPCTNRNRLVFAQVTQCHITISPKRYFFRLKENNCLSH